MAKYEKPVVVVNQELAEGVYANSGTTAGAKCDSKYRQGVWKAPDYSDWNGGTRGYENQFGCLGCPAYTNTGCGLDSHYIESGKAQSYDVDDGNRKPSWEKKNYDPDTTVSDWNM